MIKNTEDFIKKAVEGKWDGSWLEVFKPFTSQGNYEYVIHRVLLDPLAWSAVGVVEGWDEHGTCTHYPDGAYRHKLCKNGMERWKYNMNNLTPVLISGQSIDGYLKSL